MALLKGWGLRLYRAGIIVGIVLLVRANLMRLEIEGDWPVTVAEVQPFYPGAVRLRTDVGTMGHAVVDKRGERIGYVVRTLPIADSVFGYSGPTDVLVAFDAGLKVVGVAVRRSPDTQQYVDEVLADPQFLKSWNGKTWDELAAMDSQLRVLDGVSGATVTSMAIAESITYRLAHNDHTVQNARFKMQNEQPSSAHALATREKDTSWGARDTGLSVLVAFAALIAFTRLKRWMRLRRAWQAAVIACAFWSSGGLLAVTLFRGWAVSFSSWHVMAGLVLLAAAAFAAPWLTGRQLYCHYICPHGAAQELLGRIAPRTLRVTLPRGVAAGLRWLPLLLLALGLSCTILVLPLELAAIEPFDAYSIRAVSWTPIAIAVAGLLACLSVPMAYCRFGCPTGALLRFVSSHGPGDRFGAGDAAAAGLLALAAVLYWNCDVVRAWLM